MRSKTRARRLLLPLALSFLACSGTPGPAQPFQQPHPQPTTTGAPSEATDPTQWLEGLELSFTNPGDLTTYTATGPYEVRNVAADRMDMVGFDPANGAPVSVTLWIREHSLWAQAWFGTREFLTRVR